MGDMIELDNLQSQSQTQDHNVSTSVQPPPQNEGYWKRVLKNMPQSNSIGTVSFIFISGGINMSWKLGLSISSTPIYNVSTHFILSWFIGGIIGVILGALACNNTPKKILLTFASILVTISGTLQVAGSNFHVAILASRYVNGIAVGLVFPMTFVLISEEAVKSLRGLYAGIVDSMCFSCGIFIQISCSALWSIYFDINSFQEIQLNGILNIVCGVIAFVMGYLLVIESPVYYLAQEQEQMATDSLRRLQKPFIITNETNELLEELKLYLAESKEKSLKQNITNGISPLLKLCFYRSFISLGFSYFVNFIVLYSFAATTSHKSYPFILYSFARWLGALITPFTLDSRGRKVPMIIGFAMCTILTFAIGGILNDKLNLMKTDYMTAVNYLLIILQLFNSVSMASSSTYLSEAFPLAVKPYYVAIVFMIEMLVHIVIIMFRYEVQHISEYFLTYGFLSLGFLGVAIFVMPETKCSTLSECLPKFRNYNNLHNKKFNK